MGTSAKNTLNPLPMYEPFILNVFKMHPAECASEIKGTVALRSAGGFGRLSVQARNGFRRLSAGGLTARLLSGNRFLIMTEMITEFVSAGCVIFHKL